MWPFSSKYSLQQSDFLKGWTDRHSHILPGVDDGIQTIEDSIVILSMYEQIGVKKVWLTPHIMEDCPNTPEKLKTRFEELKSAYKGNIELALSAENMMDGLFIKRLEQGILMPYGDNNNELLIETSYVQPPMRMESILRDMQKAGITPVLAHPERYLYMDAEKYENIKEMGVKFQLNITSLIGAYGNQVKERAEYLLNEGYYNYSGSDAHSYHAIQRAFEHKALKKNMIAAIRQHLSPAN
jgi:tyrosine-protein phosphatase YwqE